MTGDRYLTRARLRRDVPAAALRALLLPRGDGERTAAAHHLVWTLFGDTAERTRDFLWREAKPGLFYLLSARPPEDRHSLFDLDPPKPFAPELVAGDRLAFALRVNATVARGGDGRPGAQRRRGKPCDIVMDAIRSVPSGARAASRTAALARVAHEWLASRGMDRGFVLPQPVAGTSSPADEESRYSTRVLSYRMVRLEHGRREAASVEFGVLDLEGTLEVCDPAAFVAAVGQGFGRGKAFGCGLMLIRRA